MCVDQVQWKYFLFINRCTIYGWQYEYRRSLPFSVVQYCYTESGTEEYQEMNLQNNWQYLNIKKVPKIKFYKLAIVSYINSVIDRKIITQYTYLTNQNFPCKIRLYSRYFTSTVKSPTVSRKAKRSTSLEQKNKFYNGGSGDKYYWNWDIHCPQSLTAHTIDFRHIWRQTERHSRLNPPGCCEEQFVIFQRHPVMWGLIR